MARHLLTDFELMILLAVLRTGDEAYGVRIAREIEAITGRRVMLGAAYAALERLENNGLASSSTGTATPERGGRAKRFFRTTKAGTAAVKASLDTVSAMTEGVELKSVVKIR